MALQPIFRRICALLAVIAALISADVVVGETTAQQEAPPPWSAADYWDIAPGAEVTIFPAPSNGFSAALSRDGVRRWVWGMLASRLAGKTVGGVRMDLENLIIEVEPGPQTSTRIEGETIIVSDGHIRAASLFAYSVAVLETRSEALGCYIQWFDFFVDALVQGDPVTMIDQDYPALLAALGATRGQSREETTPYLFQETVVGFTAFLLAHEAAHAVLGHTKQRPTGDALAQAAISRQDEAAADALALLMLMEANLFSPRALAAWFGWQLIRDVAISVSKGGQPKELRAHPLPQDRLTAALEIVRQEGELDEAGQRVIIDGYESLVAKYRDATLTGRVRPAIRLRGEPPLEVDIRMQRAMLRATSLQFCAAGEPITLPRRDPE